MPLLVFTADLDLSAIQLRHAWEKSSKREVADVAQLAVRHVLNKQPVHVKLALPLVLRPDASAGAVVHRRAHLRHAAEVPAAVDAEQQVDGPFGVHAPEGGVQALVAVLRAAPDGVLDGAVDVVLGVALDDEHAAVLQVPVELLGVVAVGRPQLLQHGVGLRPRLRRHAAAAPAAVTDAAAVGGAAAVQAAAAVAQVAVARRDPAGLGRRGGVVVLVRLRRTLHGHLLHEGLGRLDGLLEGGQETGDVGVELGLLVVVVVVVRGQRGGHLGNRPFIIPSINVHVVFEGRWRQTSCGEGRASLAGLLAIAAHDVGFGGGMPIGVPPLPVATAAATEPPPREPAFFTPKPLPAQHALLKAVHTRRLTQGVTVETRLTIGDQGASQGAGGVAVTAPIGGALSLLALRTAGAPGGEGRVLGEKVKPVRIDAAAEAARLPEHGVVHEVMVSIAERGVGRQVGDWWVASCRPRSLTERVRKSNGGGIVAGQRRLTDTRSWTMQCRISMYWYSSQQLSTVVCSGFCWFCWFCWFCHPEEGRPWTSQPGPLSFHHERCDDTPRERTSLSCRRDVKATCQLYAGSVLDDTKQAQDDRDDVEEVDHDGSPLVAEEVKHLPLQHSDLEGSTGAETEFRDTRTY
ncbi:hypothetical protein EYF80_016445 [Liparis tanakae]|uniref:Uncharacterized protein n=1 Tax=Liparis tanakae TaxID=230148 RepID=A0A4Z2I7N0_9TELE|nr:hypothetical protein EYF80_016445 [Liparis tanakae]